MTIIKNTSHIGTARVDVTEGGTVIINGETIVNVRAIRAIFQQPEDKYRKAASILLLDGESGHSIELIGVKSSDLILAFGDMDII